MLKLPRALRPSETASLLGSLAVQRLIHEKPRFKVMRDVLDAMERGVDLQLRIGASLTTNGRACVIQTIGGNVSIFELDGEQSALLGIEASSLLSVVQVVPSRPAAAEHFDYAVSSVELAADAGEPRANVPFRLLLSYSQLRAIARPMMAVVRWDWDARPTYVIVRPQPHSLDPAPPGVETSWSFVLPSAVTEKTLAQPVVLPVFVSLCTLAPGLEQSQRLSDWVSLLLTVR